MSAKCPRCGRVKSQTFYTRDSDRKDWWICLECGKYYRPGEPSGGGVSVYDDSRGEGYQKRKRSYE